MSKTERIDRTLIWSLRIFGLALLALVALGILVTVVVFVATAISG